MERTVSETTMSQAEAQAYLKANNNWGRWGKDDEVGAINLITAAKRLEAVSLVEKARTISLSRPFPKTPAPNNPTPAMHWMRKLGRRFGVSGVIDFYGISYHGQAATHIDALCHVWDDDGLWNGRSPDVVAADGTQWGSIQNWSQGIVTRGVLLDVPTYRGEPYVPQGRPVTAAELEAVAKSQGVEVRPGDALCVYSGRENHDRAEPQPWGTPGIPRPGLHASCLRFIREHDVSVLVWDMMDEEREEDCPWGTHSAIFAFGVPLVDNSLLEPLAAVCAEEGRYEFMLMLCPLVVEGGTGSPLNPIAMF
jgi:kynurenine formamidase